MTREEIIAWAISKGWRQDEKGNLRKEHKGTEYRLKFRKKKLVYEGRVLQDIGYSESKMGYRWTRLSSSYYKDLSIADEGKLMGMKRKI